MNSTTLNALAAHIEATTGTKPTKDVVFSAAILALQSAGMDLAQAFDAVLGAGRFEQFAGSLHDALNAA